MSGGGFFTHMNPSPKEVTSKSTFDSEKDFFSIDQRPKHPFRPQAPSFRYKSPNTADQADSFIGEATKRQATGNGQSVQMEAPSVKPIDVTTKSTPTQPNPRQQFESIVSTPGTSDGMKTISAPPSRPVSASARSTSSTAALMERDRSRRPAPPKRSLETLSSLPSKQQWAGKEEAVRRLSERLECTKRLHRDKMELCTAARAELGKEVASALVEDNTVLRCQLRTLQSRAMEALQEAERCML